MIEVLHSRSEHRDPRGVLQSHSALREGWDNPNVFQICTLRHSDSTTAKRQEVGRGLRMETRDALRERAAKATQLEPIAEGVTLLINSIFDPNLLKEMTGDGNKTKLPEPRPKDRYNPCNSTQ